MQADSSKDSPSKDSPRKIVFCCMRDEAPFLLEWAAYQKVVGFTDIVVYSNDCTDGTDMLLDLLAEHGIVQHVRHHPRTLPQAEAVNHFMASGRFAVGDHIMHMDADEFLNIHLGRRRLDDLIAWIGGHVGVLVPWRLFGDGGHDRFAGRLISDAYVMAAPADAVSGATVKTFLRVTPELARLSVHRPTYTPEFWARDKTFVTAAGAPIDITKPGHAGWVAGVPGFAIPSEDALGGIVQVNHYQYRSAAAFALKDRRGWAADKRSATPYKPANAPRFNVNRVEDRSILALAPEVSALLAQWMVLPGIGDLTAKITAAFRQSEDRYLAQGTL